MQSERRAGRWHCSNVCLQKSAQRAKESTKRAYKLWAYTMNEAFASKVTVVWGLSKALHHEKAPEDCTCALHRPSGPGRLQPPGENRGMGEKCLRMSFRIKLRPALGHTCWNCSKQGSPAPPTSLPAKRSLLQPHPPAWPGNMSRTSFPHRPRRAWCIIKLPRPAAPIQPATSDSRAVFRHRSHRHIR